jgi:hypothetical protein
MDFCTASVRRKNNFLGVVSQFVEATVLGTRENPKRTIFLDFYKYSSRNCWDDFYKKAWPKAMETGVSDVYQHVGNRQGQPNGALFMLKNSH